MHASLVKTFEDGVVIQGSAVPYVDLRVIRHFASRDKVSRLIGHRQTDHFGVML